jgi:hypothetical protein
MKASFSFSYIILFAGALSMGCVAQAGTDDTSQAEELTANQAVVQQQAAPTTKERVQLAPQVAGKNVVAPTNKVPRQLEGLTGTDPGDNVQDDGDGKEPDPHPWHVDNARVSH